MTLAAHTLGCKLNFVETSHFLRQMAERGHTVVDFTEVADVYVINTCTVTAVAEKKCRTYIHQAARRNPDACIVVVGCFAQREPDAIRAIPGVSLVVGNDQKHLLPEMIEGFGVRGSRGKESDGQPFSAVHGEGFRVQFSGSRTRTFIKIQDGCDYFCTYCAIPFARGRSRSATIAETVAAVKEIAASGAPEIVLTGINTGTFGQQHGEHLIDLFRELDKIDTVLRYRISSIEPNLITDEIIDFVAGSRAFLPHFHIPLQAGSDKVLQLMHRRYDTVLYASRIEHIKRVMPHACIAADVITGFNGEDDEAFAQGKAFIDSLPISYLHIFPYSERPGTAALRMSGKVPVHIRRQRSADLHELSDRKRAAFVAAHLGTTRQVLWEHTRHGTAMQGWTDNYIRLQQPYDPALAGTVTPYPITNSTIVENFSPDD